MKCPECEREVSGFAEVCPHCGYKLKVTKDKASKIIEGEYRRKWIGGIIGGIILIIGGVIMLLKLLDVPEYMKYNPEYGQFIGMSIAFIIIGVFLIPISIYKLTRY